MGGDLAVLVDGLGGIGARTSRSAPATESLWWSVAGSASKPLSITPTLTPVPSKAAASGGAGMGEVGRQPGMPVSLMGTTGAGLGGSGGATGSAGVAGSGV
ncbi:hypothetical protein WJ966_00490 [Achromobacter xylosoxidans]